MFTEKNISEKGRHRLYLVLDCETATLPMADEIAKNSQQKKDIAISKPLIYDIGWTIVDSDLNLYEKKSFLVTEVFSVPQVFNTAYYKEKRPIYIDRLRKGETCLKSWNEIAEILFESLQKVTAVCAFNAMFDFKKAIPFTEQYIYHVYNNDFQNWEAHQRQSCLKIVGGEKNKNEGKFDSENFQFKGIDFPIIDIWGVACDSLINNVTYKKSCLENKMITESGKFFKTSAESTYRYLLREYQFEEAHTAIDDAIIESFILHKALKKGKVLQGIIYFPFKLLGTTIEFLEESPRGITIEHVDYIIQVMETKLASYTNQSRYAMQFENLIDYVKNLRDNIF